MCNVIPRLQLQIAVQVVNAQGVVRKEGLEPPYLFGYQILSLARLPVPPLSLKSQPSRGWGRWGRGGQDHAGPFVHQLPRGWRERVQEPAAPTALRFFTYVPGVSVYVVGGWRNHLDLLRTIRCMYAVVSRTVGRRL